MSLAFAVLLFMPRKYASEAKLFVRLGRESVTLDPTATTGQMVQIQETRENQINSTRDMLLSHSLLDRVVQVVGAEAIMRGSLDDGDSPGLIQWLASGARCAIRLATFAPPVSVEEQAAEKLSKSIEVKAGRNTSVIDLSCQAKNPKLAQSILQAFLDTYQEQHLAANKTVGSLEFFTTQATRLKQQLDAATAGLRDAKNESGLVSLPVEQKALQDQLTQLETAALAAAAALASSEASVESLRSLMEELPHQLPTQQTSGFANAAADTMQQDYFRLRITLRDLESRLGPEHPQVIDTREQIKHAEALLNGTSPDRTQATVGWHPSRQALDLDLRREVAQTMAVRAKTAILQQQLAAVQHRTQDLNDHEIRITELEREVALADTNYRSYSDHLEQARIGDAIEVNRISNVNVVQPPSYVERPVSPKPPLVLGVALILALSGSVGLAFVLEYLDNSLKTPDDLEEQLGVPVLASIPRARGAKLCGTTSPPGAPPSIARFFTHVPQFAVTP